MDAFFFIAIAIIFGFIGSCITRRIGLPGVVGYLIGGLFFGPSFLGVFDEALCSRLEIFTGLALSIIAFTIGSELKLSTFRQMGKGIGVITVLESLGAFLIVAGGIYLLTGQLALALMFGALAPASAPAGTVAVLQEYKAKGRLTNALYAVVGLDDGLAIVIFSLSVAAAKIIFTGEAGTVAGVVGGPVVEIIGSIAAGVVTGLLAGYVVKRMKGEEAVLAVSLAAIFLCTGVSYYMGFSLILANLSLGMTFTNVFAAANRRASRKIESISLPVYIIFFFIAGAHIRISLLTQLGIIGLVYIICRIVGLFGGAYIGAALSKQSSVIRKYLGLGILSQAGVAIGLSVLAAGEFGSFGDEGRQVGLVLINTIMATTIIFEIIGPIGAKYAISKAKEAGVNITEDDLIQTYKVGDVMETEVPVIMAGMSLQEVINIVSDTDDSHYPVVDNGDKLIGIITLDGIRKTFNVQELNDWLVALDVMEAVTGGFSSETALSEALEQMRRKDTEYMPVVDVQHGNRLIGGLNKRAVWRKLSAEVLSRQRKAEILH